MTPEFHPDSSPSPDDRWFSDHVLPHEPMLRAWLRSRFPHGFELDDLVQEAFARVLRARAAGSAMRSPKAFFFRHGPQSRARHAAAPPDFRRSYLSVFRVLGRLG